MCNLDQSNEDTIGNIVDIKSIKVDNYKYILK